MGTVKTGKGFRTFCVCALARLKTDSVRKVLLLAWSVFIWDRKERVAMATNSW